MFSPGARGHLYSHRQPGAALFYLASHLLDNITGGFAAYLLAGLHSGDRYHSGRIPQQIVDESVITGRNQVAAGPVGESRKRADRTKHQVERATFGLVERLLKALLVGQLLLNQPPVMQRIAM